MKHINKLRYGIVCLMLIVVGCGKQETINMSQSRTSEKDRTPMETSIANENKGNIAEIEQVNQIKTFKSWNELLTYAKERSNLLSTTVRNNSIECFVAPDYLWAYVDSRNAKKDLFDNEEPYTIGNIFIVDYAEGKIIEEFRGHMFIYASNTKDDLYIKTFVGVANQMFPGIDITTEEVVNEAQAILNDEKWEYSRVYQNVCIEISISDSNQLNFSIEAETAHTQDFTDITTLL